jgi:hypothetical protein
MSIVTRNPDVTAAVIAIYAVWLAWYAWRRSR